MKKLALLGLAFALNVFSPLGDAIAKPEYCYDALAQCNARCEEIYSALNPGRYGCYAGCSIGWALCGV